MTISSLERYPRRGFGERERKREGGGREEDKGTKALERERQRGKSIERVERKVFGFDSKHKHQPLNYFFIE